MKARSRGPRAHSPGQLSSGAAPPGWFCRRLRSPVLASLRSAGHRSARGAPAARTVPAAVKHTPRPELAAVGAPAGFAGPGAASTPPPPPPPRWGGGPPGSSPGTQLELPRLLRDPTRAVEPPPGVRIIPTTPPPRQSARTLPAGFTLLTRELRPRTFPPRTPVLASTHPRAPFHALPYPNEDRTPTPSLERTTSHLNGG
jgi:hypothetical protein